MSRPRFGVALPPTDNPNDTVELAVLAERLGLDLVAITDPDQAIAATLLAAIAARTNRIGLLRIGTPLSISTVDTLSRGRVRTDAAGLHVLAEGARPSPAELAELAGRTGGVLLPSAGPDAVRWLAEQVEYGARPIETIADRLTLAHDHLRAELAGLRELLARVVAGTTAPDLARARLNAMAIRQHNWTFGAFCASYCRVVTQHHVREDTDVFPLLRATQPALAPVLDRLDAEHRLIHHLIERLDATLVAFITGPPDVPALTAAVDALSDGLLSHLSYEEQELTEPLALRRPSEHRVG